MRPASHKWAVFVLVTFFAVNVMLALKGAFDVFTGAIILLCVAALIGLFAFSRARRTYLIVALTLTLIALRGAYYGVLQPAHQLLARGPTVREDWLAIGFQAFGIILLFLLVRAFTFGAASRAFYGFPPGRIQAA